MLGENLVANICLDVRSVKWKQTKKKINSSMYTKGLFIQATFPRHHLL